MKINNYEKEKALVGRLAQLKAIKEAEDEMDCNYEIAKKFVNDAWEGILGEDALKYVEDMLDLVDDMPSVVKLVKRTLDAVEPVQKEPKEQIKRMKETEESIKNDIATVMKDILQENNLVEGDYIFPKLGTVRCTLKKEKIVTDEAELKKSLAENNLYDFLKLGTKTQLQKINISGLNGIKEEEVSTIKITSSK